MQTPVVMPDGGSQIIATIDALSVYSTSAEYWFTKARELETRVADLQEQLQRATRGGQ